MSQVTLTIGGRAYAVQCADGEEAQAMRLAAMVDAKVQAHAGVAGMTEARSLLFAALELADDLSEARGGSAEDNSTLAALDRLAERLAVIADAIEADLASPA